MALPNIRWIIDQYAGRKSRRLQLGCRDVREFGPFMINVGNRVADVEEISRHGTLLHMLATDQQHRQDAVTVLR